MPRRDGTGPNGSPGPGGLSRLFNIGRSGFMTRDGFCECPKCGTRVKHNRAEPCTSMKCPKCGETMARG